MGSNLLPDVPGHVANGWADTAGAVLSYPMLYLDRQLQRIYDPGLPQSKRTRFRRVCEALEVSGACLQNYVGLLA